MWHESYLIIHCLLLNEFMYGPYKFYELTKIVNWYTISHFIVRRNSATESPVVTRVQRSFSRNNLSKPSQSPRIMAWSSISSFWVRNQLNCTKDGTVSIFQFLILFQIHDLQNRSAGLKWYYLVNDPSIYWHLIWQRPFNNELRLATTIWGRTVF